MNWWTGKKHSKEAKEKMRKAKIKNPVRYWLGKKRSEETIKKMSEAVKGKHYSPKTEFKKGHIISKETRKKMSKANKSSGKSHYLWKGGVTPLNKKIRKSIEYRLWREAVFARDNWICQHCGKRGKELHSHHIKSFAEYPELRFAIDNGLTLCKECHRKIHSNNFKGGK